MKNIKLVLLCALFLLPAWAGESAAAPRQRELRASPLAASLRQVRRVPSPAARAAFSEFARKQGRGWKVRYSPRTALPEALTGGLTARYPGTPEQAAMAFFAENKDLLKVDPAALRLTLKKEFMGVTHLQYQQYKDGVPVEFSYARVHVTADGAVSGYQGRFEPDLQLNTTPGVSEQAAVLAARADLGRQLAVSRTELVIYPDEASGELKLAWKVRGRAGGLWVYYIDASAGSVLYKYDDLRYMCPGGPWNTYGTSTGRVFAVSPRPGYDSPDSMGVTEDLWTPPVAVPLRDQYFWIKDYSSMTVTNAAGDYCSTRDGKVFSSLKGPYFAVTNYRGASAHYDNGGGQWLPITNSVQTPHPYPNSWSQSYSINIPDSWSANGYTFAKVMPRFTSFSAGQLDIYGSVNDADQVSVKNGDAVLGAYIGTRSAPFFGAAVENPSYSVELQSDASGASSGFIIDISSYLVLTNNPGYSSNPGSPFWSTGTPGLYIDTTLGAPNNGVNGLSEVNAFYHLNAIHRYFDPLNKNSAVGGGAAVDLSAQVPVMVHAAGDPDSLTGCATGCRGMMNAYYDLEKKHILLGDGLMDNSNKYRSFALDGTIVRHEYIHLVTDHIYPIVNFGEFGAISEGIADYFSLASFWREGYGDQRTLGNFVGAGEGAARDISGSGAPTQKCVFGQHCLIAPGYDTLGWAGEVHDDGLLLSQSLYELRSATPTAPATDPVTDMGTFTAGTFAGQSRADVLAFAALFYFPDTFANFFDAMKAACDQFERESSGQCTAAMKTKIDVAFADHNIGATGVGVDAFEASSSTVLCDNNNGPECASDISSLSSLSATVYPLGDVDYYSLPLAAGDFSAELSLPMSDTEGIYYAYGLFLFDSNRTYVTEAGPAVYGTGSDACPDSGQCYTLAKSVRLNYTVPLGGGRYYLVVSAAPNQYYGNSEANSTRPYSLTLGRTPQGSASARMYSASFDNDELAYDVPYPYFPMAGSPSSSTLTGAELVFQYAQLRDHDYQPIPQTRTDAAGSYLAHVATAFNAGPSNLDVYGRRQISGRVKLQPGFAARYPGLGTVYLEVFGRNHLGHVLSLGVSNALNLTANRSAVTAYNNIIGSGAPALIKYEVLSPGTLTVQVYTQAGALVRTVYDGPVPAGKGTLEWDGTNSGGGKTASGIYFVKTRGPGVDKVVKIAVIR